MFSTQHLHPQWQPRDERLGVQQELTFTPQYRSSRTGNRQTRTTQIDHDVFEGLPVRHWRKKQTHVNYAPSKETVKPIGDIDHGYPELSLPRDFSMLPESSQILLRAARLGLRKRPRDLEEDKENEEHDAPEAREESNGFLMSRWNLVPRDLEGPEPEYLAKRRKGLSSSYGETKDTSPTQMQRLKVKKVDAEGKTTVWEALVPKGQEVDGEIIEDDASPILAAPGTVVEGVGVVNADGLVVAGEQPTPTPARRRPPIPKKKKKHGPGRGRKKVVETAPGEAGEIAVNGVDTNGHAEASKADVPDGEDNLDGSALHDGNQEDEGSDEGSDEGDDDREEGEISPEPGEIPIAKAEGISKMTTSANLSLPAKPNPPHSFEDTNGTGLAPKTVETTLVSTTPVQRLPDISIVTEAADSGAEMETQHPKASPTDRSALPPDPYGQGVHAEQATIPAPDHMDIDPVQAVVNPLPPSPTSLKTLESVHNNALMHDVAQADSSAHPIVNIKSHEFEPSTNPSLKSTFSTSPPPGLSLPALPEPPLSPPVRAPTPPPILAQQPPPPQPSSERLPPPQASPSRRASNANPSPKAPTPSPPTPIQEAFAQGLSPKAPTMSPPTPIPTDDFDDDLPEPPSFTLSKSQIIEVGMDGAQDEPPPSIPGLKPQGVLEVEGAPQIDEPNVNAEIPLSHNPIEGLAAPAAPPPGRDLESYQNRTVDSQMEVEAAPSIPDPKMDAEIPHDHVRVQGLVPPEVPPKERRLEERAQDEKAEGGEKEQ